MDKERINYLFGKYVDKTASLSERDELMQYIYTAPEEEIVSLLEEAYQFPDLDEEMFTTVQRTKMLDAILPDNNSADVAPEPKKVFFSKSIVLKFTTVAALLLVTLTIGFLFYKDRTKSVDSDLVQQTLGEDILPGENRATLRLANGDMISLNDIPTGNVVEQQGVVVTKTEDGQLLYQVHATDNNAQAVDEVELTYHIITTPKGGQYQVLLPDGTKVWLNAASSLKYPPLFSKTERRVELTGEGYFEVAPNKLSPFIVQTENQSVKVLGTHFNINAYKDTRNTSTTLLEGSVMIDYSSSEKRNSQLLKPGQQAVLNGEHRLAVKTVDLSNAVAWKNGLFYFENTPVEQVLAEFARWYNFDFEFEDGVPDINLWGSVYRNVNAAEALEILDYFNLKYRLIKDAKEKSKWKIVVSNL